MSNVGQIASSPFPIQRVPIPDYLDWHVILEPELGQLSRPETGVIGSLGFAALGAAVGFAPSFLSALDKAASSQPSSLADAAFIASFSGTAVAGVLCLVLFGIAALRKRGLTRTIRARKRRAVDEGLPARSA